MKQNVPKIDQGGTSQKPTTAEPSQFERFHHMARKLGADENEAAFKAKLAVIARQKPKDAPAPAKADKGKR